MIEVLNYSNDRTVSALAGTWIMIGQDPKLQSFEITEIS